MRTTIDLDPALHREALAVADATHRSLSAVVNDALRSVLHPIPPVTIDPVTGLATIRLGRPVSSREVSDVLDDV